MHRARSRDTYAAGLMSAPQAKEGALFHGRWKVECIRDGQVVWSEEFHNIVVNQGLDELLNAALANQGATSTWYVGLKGSGTPAAGDTMASHPTWSEITAYNETTRPTWTPNGAAVSQTVSNSNNRAQFTMNTSTTVYGAFLTSSSTKGGNTGKLYAAGDFSASRSVVSGDILLVTAQFGAADDGV